VQVSADGADVWFRSRGDGLQLVAARQGDLMVEYDEVVASAPRVVRLLKRGDGQLPVDLRLSLAQVELNPTLPPEAFTVDVPASARPMTLDELRQSGPLGQSAPSNRSRAEPPTDP
jgi:hypothetical protein